MCPPTSGLKLSAYFLDLGMGSVSGADTTRTFSLGEDKEKPDGEERDLGQEKRPQGMRQQEEKRGRG